jgi:hypothetical protein
LALLLLDEMEKKPSREGLLMLGMDTQVEVIRGYDLGEVMGDLRDYVNASDYVLKSHTVTFHDGYWWATAVMQNHRSAPLA